MNYYSNYLTIGLELACPSEGSFVGWKKAQGKLIKLQICEDAKRSSATTRKCRCSKVLVLDIEGYVGEIASDYDSNFIYKIGEIAEVKDFDENRWNECSAGIHFFMNKHDAETYE